MKNTHGHKGTPVHEHTHSRIEAYMRKHRAAGGGVDDAEKDLKDKPERYNKSKVEDEAEATKAKKGGVIEGKKAKSHAGRKSRAAGGACEKNPFTTALHGSGPRAKKVEKETTGKDE